MEPDVRRLLKNSAAEPVTRIEPAALWRAGRRQRDRRLILAVAGALVICGGMFAAVARPDLFTDRSPPQQPAHVSVSPSDEATRGEGWRKLPDAPISPRSGEAAVWTGREVIIWGGATRDATLRSSELSDGAAYDPAESTWRSIVDAPIRGSSYEAVWTGTEMIAWGGIRAADQQGPPDGAAYDPDADAWRTIAQSPLEARDGSAVVWTGNEMIVWGGYLVGQDRNTFPYQRYARDGAAYDPATDEWRTLAPSPLPAGYDPMTVWTGEEMIIFTTESSDPAAGKPNYPVGAAYDPATDRWRELGSSPLFPIASPPAIWLKGEMLFMTFGELEGHSRNQPPTAGAYNPSTDSWRILRSAPSYASSSYLTPIATDDEVLFGTFAYDPVADVWRKLPRAPIQDREFPTEVWTGTEVIVWGGAKAPRGGTIVNPPPLATGGAAYRPH